MRLVSFTMHNRDMRKLLSACALIVSLSTAVLAATQTMRLDYYHTGNSSREIFSVDRVSIEPLPWPGDL